MKTKMQFIHLILILFVILDTTGCSTTDNVSNELPEKGFIGNLYDDGENRKHKAIIVLGGSEGGISWNLKNDKNQITYLVNEGYAVLAVAYFKYQGLPNSLEDIPLEYFEKIFLWLSQLPNIVPNHYAIMGGSKGAELVLLLGSRYPVVKTVIALSPGSKIFQGIPNGFSRPTGSWAYNGQSLPYVKIGLSFALFKATKTNEWYDVFKKALKKYYKKQLNQADIPVENIRGPILLLSGSKDKMWPATEMSKEIVDRLKTNSFKYEYNSIIYNCGHAVDEHAFPDIYRFLSQYFPSSMEDTIAN